MSGRKGVRGKRRARALAGLDTSLVEFGRPVGSSQLDGRTTRSGTYVRPDQPTPDRNIMVAPVQFRDRNHQARASVPRIGPSSCSAKTEKGFRNFYLKRLPGNIYLELLDTKIYLRYIDLPEKIT